MSDDAAFHRLAFRAFADFSGTIAAPAVLAAILGGWIDDRYGIEPFGSIGCLLFAFLFTALLLVKKVREYGAQYIQLTEKDSSKRPPHTPSP